MKKRDVDKIEFEVPGLGKVEAIRISPAASVGDCWHCGRRRLWHRLFGWLTGCDYEPLLEESFQEFERLSNKHRSKP